MSNTLLETNPSIESLVQPRTLEAMKAQYQLDQQEKFLSIRAEAETLLQQLQAIKQQRQELSNSSVEA
ncbi:MAG TPA: hypothetical protein IGS53_14845 [Leptolyngbyaceae cyanobacterium M33_DOE_097]|uniref:Uncharacterized protein n=1 Tax=Oscillatoriales cyanobacterium SpSt-418 TaxID=2282169 RepID=A0A7C3KI02_9CYAN|nr:hypothetical protein [Leptolyngbyaceae cyanobacterium M33_DOE_097]